MWMEGAILLERSREVVDEPQERMQHCSSSNNNNDSNRKNEKIEDRKDRATRETTVTDLPCSSFSSLLQRGLQPTINPSTHSYYDDYDKQANKH